MMFTRSRSFIAGLLLAITVAVTAATSGGFPSRPRLQSVGVNATPPASAGDIAASGTVTAGTFSGSGASLTSLPAGNLTGSVADARLSANVPLKNAANTFTGVQTFNGGTSDQVLFQRSGITTGWMGADAGGIGIFGAAAQTGPGLYITATQARLYKADGSVALTLGSAGNLTVAAPSSGTTMALSAVSGQRALSLATSAGVGPTLSFAQTGQTEWQVYQPASNNTLRFYNGSDRLVIDSGIQVGSPTGGDKGAGTLNTAGAIYQNNVAVALSTDLSALNASNLTSGTVPDARFPATLPAASGANLTALNASNLSSGTVAAARLPIKAVGFTAINNTSTAPSATQKFTVGATAAADASACSASICQYNLTGFTDSTTVMCTAISQSAGIGVRRGSYSGTSPVAVTFQTFTTSTGASTSGNIDVTCVGT